MNGSDDAARYSRADFALLRRAARERWGVPDPLRTEALYQAAKALTDPEASHRDRIAVARFLLAADKSDRELEQTAAAIEAPEHDQAADFEIDLAPSPDAPP